MSCLWLASRGHDVHFIGPASEGPRAHEQILGTVSSSIIRGNCSGALMWHTAYLRAVMNARIKSRSRQVFYVCGSGACPVAWIALQGIPRNRIVYHTQDFLEPRRHPTWEFFERRFARRAGWVICNEPNRARFMKSYYGLPQLPAVVRTALPCAWPIPERDVALRVELCNESGLTAETGRLVAAGGGYSPVRCSEQLLMAARLLPPNYRLVFTDMKHEPTSSPGKRSIAANQISEKVIMLDRLPFQDLLRLYASCDAGLLLYPNDGIGNFYQAPGRLTEYMGAGLPFVASDCPNFRLLSLEHRVGVVCDPESGDSIAAALRKICDRSELEMAQERHRLRLLARTEFAYERDAVRIERTLERACGVVK